MERDNLALEKTRSPEALTQAVNGITVRLLAGGEYTNPDNIVDPTQLRTELTDILAGRRPVDNQPLAQYSTKDCAAYWESRGVSDQEAHDQWRQSMVDWITTSAGLNTTQNQVYNDRRSVLAGFGIHLETFTTLTRDQQNEQMEQLLGRLQNPDGETNIDAIRDAFHASAQMTNDRNSISINLLRRRLDAMDDFLNTCGEHARQAVHEAVLGQGFMYTNKQEQDLFLDTATKVANTMTAEQKQTIAPVYQEYRVLHPESQVPTQPPEQQGEPSTPLSARKEPQTTPTDTEQGEQKQQTPPPSRQEPQHTPSSDEKLVYQTAFPLPIPYEQQKTQTEGKKPEVGVIAEVPLEINEPFNFHESYWEMTVARNIIDALVTKMESLGIDTNDIQPISLRRMIRPVQDSFYHPEGQQEEEVPGFWITYTEKIPGEKPYYIPSYLEHPVYNNAQLHELYRNKVLPQPYVRETMMERLKEIATAKHLTTIQKNDIIEKEFMTEIVHGLSRYLPESEREKLKGYRFTLPTIENQVEQHKVQILQETSPDGNASVYGIPEKDRRESEDTALFLPEHATYAVFDGTTHGGGLQASTQARQFFLDNIAILDKQHDTVQDLETNLKKLLEEANSYLLSKVPEGRTNGTTAAIVKIYEQNGQKYAVIGVAGDTSVELYRNGQLNLKPELQVTAYYLGVKKDPVILTHIEPLQPNDRLLILSDGVMKPEEEWEEGILRLYSDSEKAAEQLVKTSDRDDDKTAIIIKIPPED